MRQIRIGKRCPGSASWRQEPLPAGARDPDSVHAHQSARRTSRSRARPSPARRARPDRADPRQPVTRHAAPWP